MASKVNCLLETFFDAAIEDAKKIDLYFAQHKKPVGPLHGLPVSLKDQFHVRGVDTSMGYVGESLQTSLEPGIRAKSHCQGGSALFEARRLQEATKCSKVKWSESCAT